MKTTNKTRKETATKVAKSTTTNATLSTKELAAETTTAILKDSKAAKKSQPTAEELAAKALKKSLTARDKAVNTALELTKGEICSVSNWLKVFKKHLSKQVALQLDSKWAATCKQVEMNATGQYYLEEVTTKSGAKGLKVHMCRFQSTDKIGSKTIAATKNLKGFCYDAEEGVVNISSADELTINRKVVVKTPITKVIDGEEWKRYTESVVEQTLRPYEVLDLTYGEFKKGIKAAIAAVFPNGFAVEE